MKHIPVLTKEVLEILNPKPDENFIDATVGQGGHAKLILEKTGPNGKLLGIDLDPEQIENCKELLKDYKDRLILINLILINDSYANLQKIVERNNFKPVAGILFDLGMSSWQLEESKKGFSFLKDEPLDMRYDAANDLTAEKIINQYSEKELQELFEKYGQEKFAKRIAKEIVKVRLIKEIKSTLQLVEVIKKAVPQKFQHAKIHFATRAFQALRIAVNEELENLEKVLPQALSVLSPGSRIAIISFHSLEDRIVKDFLKQKEKEGLIKILLKKPIVASDEELQDNPRARSAKLRGAII